MADNKGLITKEDALHFHEQGKPGKVEIKPTKPLMSQRDLSLAYSPGVAYPCQEIHDDPDTAYRYTAKGNTVAVISNGTAVLGLGRLGALASKPVMEGKAVLFKRFAAIDGIDVEVDTEDPDAFINAVKYLGPSWGGINLEDIAAPECFVIEQTLKEQMDIPVFHDDQHGTAIITAAGLINACELAGKKMEDIKLVVLGAGAAGISCISLAKMMGVKHALLVDRTGVIYKGRTESMNQWKSAHAYETDDRTLEDALTGADVFYGLASKGAVTKEMVASMADKPIIFAMANPDPEILPEDVRAVRDDAIIATGRSDYPNQVNNVMGFPYIFRGALDVHATDINEEMKLAAAEALARLAREDVPEEVSSAYAGRKMRYGSDYIIPTPFDPRLISTIPPAVAKAAMDTGVARRPISDFADYKRHLRGLLDPTANSLNLIFERVKESPKRVLFAEGEEEKMVRAAVQWRDNGYGTPVLIGREDRIMEAMHRAQVSNREGIEISNAAINDCVDDYIEFLYAKLQRQGYLHRDVVRMVKNDRNIYGACMLAMGEGDCMITGLTRNYYVSLEDITKVIDTKPGHILFGVSLLLTKGGTVFVSDTAVNELPSAEDLADITEQTVAIARLMGHQNPRAALLSFSNFGNPIREKTKRVREAIGVLDGRHVDFEYEGEMSPDVALDPEMMKLYPFSRLSGPANVLIMPALHSAHIASYLYQELSSGTVIGPMLTGLEQPVQIVQMGATVSDILNQAALAAVDTLPRQAEPTSSAKSPKQKAA